jgi:hypothetical protein
LSVNTVSFCIDIDFTRLLLYNTIGSLRRSSPDLSVGC